MAEDRTAIRLRLIEAAAALPGVRAGVDPADQAARARDVAQVWYTYVIGPVDARTPSPKARRR